MKREEKGERNKGKGTEQSRQDNSGKCKGIQHKVTERRVNSAWCVRLLHHCWGCGILIGDTSSTLQPGRLEIPRGASQNTHQNPANTTTVPVSSATTSSVVMGSPGFGRDHKMLWLSEQCSTAPVVFP